MKNISQSENTFQSLRAACRKAFSLIELLVVIAVIGIIAAIAIPNIANLTEGAGDAKNQRNAQNIVSVYSAARAAGHSGATTVDDAVAVVTGANAAEVGAAKFHVPNMATADLAAAKGYMSIAGSELIYNPAGAAPSPTP